MTLLANTLQGDRTDLELIQLVLETLANVITFEPDNSEGKRSPYFPTIVRDFL